MLLDDVGEVIVGRNGVCHAKTNDRHVRHTSHVQPTSWQTTFNIQRYILQPFDGDDDDNDDIASLGPPLDMPGFNTLLTLLAWAITWSTITWPLASVSL